MGDNERPVIAAEQTTLVQCLKGGDRAVVFQITEPSQLHCNRASVGVLPLDAAALFSVYLLPEAQRPLEEHMVSSQQALTRQPSKKCRSPDVQRMREEWLAAGFSP